MAGYIGECGGAGTLLVHGGVRISQHLRWAHVEDGTAGAYARDSELEGSGVVVSLDADFVTFAVPCASAIGCSVSLGVRKDRRRALFDLLFTLVRLFSPILCG